MHEQLAYTISMARRPIRVSFLSLKHCTLIQNEANSVLLNSKVLYGIELLSVFELLLIEHCGILTHHAIQTMHM